MMLDTDIVAVSPATVWRVLARAGLLRKCKGKPSKKGTGFKQPPQPHQHWHINPSTFPISTFPRRSITVQYPGRLQPFPGSLGSAQQTSGEHAEPAPILRDRSFERAERDRRALLQAVHAVRDRQMPHESRG
jgi:hypothetical protein